jgi:hypothetical protein
MGLFSTIYSSYRLEPSLCDGFFQTKDLTNLLDEYWLSPDGELFRISFPYKLNLSGKIARGRVEPFDLDGSITVISLDNQANDRQQWTFSGGKLSEVLILDRVGERMLDKRLVRS